MHQPNEESQIYLLVCIYFSFKAHHNGIQLVFKYNFEVLVLQYFHFKQLYRLLLLLYYNLEEQIIVFTRLYRFLDFTP